MIRSQSSPVAHLTIVIKAVEKCWKLAWALRASCGSPIFTLAKSEHPITLKVNKNSRIRRPSEPRDCHVSSRVEMMILSFYAFLISLMIRPTLKALRVVVVAPNPENKPKAANMRKK